MELAMEFRSCDATYDLLDALIAVLAPERVVETGTGEGYGTQRLRSAAGPGRVVTVDNRPVEQTVEGVEYVLADSLDYARDLQAADLAFVDCSIDGRHRERVVHELLTKARVVVLDDTRIVGVQVLYPPMIRLLSTTGSWLWVRDIPDRDNVDAAVPQTIERDA